MGGVVVFVGAGPGAADLITLRGARRLAEAEVVLCDALTDPALRALAPRAHWIDVGKRGYRASTGQAAISALLVRCAREHRVVVRLKGGDPSVFGRLDEELAALAAAGIACEVVPGVTAALAAAADSRRPLTRRGRGRSVTLATAMTREGRLAPCRPRADSEVYYMAGRQLGALGRRLQAEGWPADTVVCVVSRAGWPDALASTHALAELGHAVLLHAGRPTVVTVGTAAEAPAGPVSAAAGAREAGAVVHVDAPVAQVERAHAVLLHAAAAPVTAAASTRIGADDISLLDAARFDPASIHGPRGEIDTERHHAA